jgi:hypothetical protein
MSLENAINEIEDPNFAVETNGDDENCISAEIWDEVHDFLTGPEEPRSEAMEEFPECTVGEDRLRASLLNNMDREEFQRIPALAFRAMAPGELARMNPERISMLTNDQWEHLACSHQHLRALTYLQLRALSQEQIQFVYPWMITSLDVSQLADEQLRHLTGVQRNALSSEQLDSLGGSVLKPHLPRALRQLFPTDENLSVEGRRVANTTPADIRAGRQVFDAVHIPYLLPGQLAAFSQAQLVNLLGPGPTPELVNRLSYDQIMGVLQSPDMRRANSPFAMVLRRRAQQIDPGDY